MAFPTCGVRLVKKWFGKRCLAKLGTRTFEVLVFDFARMKRRKSFVENLFGDCKVPGDYPEWLERTPRGTLEWKHPTVVPFALLEPAKDEKFVDGDIHPQFHALWVTDLKKAGPVYELDVDGSVMPAKKPPVLTRSLKNLTFSEAPSAPKPKKRAAPSFDEHAAALENLRVGGPPAYPALEVLHELRGGKGPNPKPPPGRDPRWVDALRVELEACLWADSYVDMVAATIESFPDVGAGVAEQILASLAKTKPTRPLAARFIPVTNMLLRAKSAAAVEHAIAILEKHEVDDDDSLCLYLRLHGRPEHVPRLRKLAKARPEYRDLPRVMVVIQERFADA